MEMPIEKNNKNKPYVLNNVESKFGNISDTVCTCSTLGWSKAGYQRDRAGSALEKVMKYDQEAFTKPWKYLASSASVDEND